jgi:hypothetical protein
LDQPRIAIHKDADVHRAPAHRLAGTTGAKEGDSKMQNRKLVTASALVLLVLAGNSPRIASAGQSGTLAPRPIAVYVADFELSAAPAAAPEHPSPAYKDKLQKDLQLRSRQIQDYFAETLVNTLQKQGYSSSRRQDLPAKGILLEGVFAEPDQKNRIRPALLGSGSPGTRFLLYIGAFDEKSMNQPLYKEAPVQEPDPNYGPVITLNAYIPMAKYEIAKDAGEEDIRQICGQIAADLTVLLQRNPAAVAQAQ